ncbi:putative 2,3-dihydroxybenzoic acid decarboxylase [Thozetella sp. PMI_491]|nr:putative 2,3-dihydroxybenzoic acid decarboxylase [Thozetella sp. PMI_491]
MDIPLITLEEHWYSEAVFHSFDNALRRGIKEWPGVLNKLLDAGEMRLQNMGKGKVSLQVISHCAAEDPSPEVCRAGNNQLAGEIGKSEEASRRFAAFAIIPLAQPEAAATELERTVKELGFVGALVDHKTQKGFCDGPEYDILWSKAQELDVPIYLHPAWPTEQMLHNTYAGNYSPLAAAAMGGPMWGWHSEVALHILRLHASGVFDRFPKLKLILGHFGEMMPFMLPRIFKQDARIGGRERLFKQVWDENIWITTSGVWSLDPLRCILGNTKIERILYSVDYPFSSNEDGLRWIEELERSGLVTREQLELIAYKNAEALLGIKALVIQ